MKKIIVMLFAAFSTLSVVAQTATTPSEYGKNILAISPIQLVQSDLFDNSGSDVSVNLSYERIFSNQHFGFKLPVSISLKNPFVYIMPTLKLYPSKQGVVRYAVGPQLFFGAGKIKHVYNNYLTSNYYPYNGYYQNYTVNESRTQFGFMINNSINFTIIKNMFLSMDMGIGIDYYDSKENINDNNWNRDNNNNPFNPIVQFNFSMGYRF